MWSRVARRVGNDPPQCSGYTRPILRMPLYRSKSSKHHGPSLPSLHLSSRPLQLLPKMASRLRPALQRSLPRPTFLSTRLKPPIPRTAAAAAPPPSSSLRTSNNAAIRAIATHTPTHHASLLYTLPNDVDPSSPTFRDNASSFADVQARVSELHAAAARGGPDKARKKHVERGKMLVRDRVAALVDPGTSFLELSALAGLGVYEGEEVPAGGIVTGIGVVEGVRCVVVANDSTYVVYGWRKSGG